MTIILALTGDTFPLWTIMDDEKATEENLEKNNYNMTGLGWNALPPELDDQAVRNNLYHIESQNEKYSMRCMNGTKAYFESKDEYDEMKRKTDAVISYLLRKREETKLEFKIFDRLSGDIEQRLFMTNLKRMQEGKEPISE